MASTRTPAIVMRTPADIAAAVGYLLGYVPGEGAIALLGMRGKTVAVGACINIHDLHTTSIGQAVSDIADRFTASAIVQAILLGYGPLDVIGDAAEAASAALDARDIAVLHSLRIDAGRCYCMHGDACLPDEGTPVLAASPPVAAAVYAGLSTQPDRASLAKLYAPVPAARRGAMDEAFTCADARLRTLVYDDGDTEGPAVLRADAAAILLAHGTAAIDTAFAQTESGGGQLPDDDAAWLLTLLAYLPVRDHAWKQITADDRHHDMLRGLVQRAPDDLAAAPACLLAFWALLAGNGPIANIALDRARTADPAYTMTRLLFAALHAAIPPGRLHDLFAQALADDSAQVR